MEHAGNSCKKGKVTYDLEQLEELEGMDLQVCYCLVISNILRVR
jgi:hypothetical protein